MPKIQLFVTCLVDSLFPEVGEATVDLLEECGMEVGCPAAQTCCGQPAFNAGYRAEARKMALHTLAIFEDQDGQVVIPSGSCAAMVRKGYLELFKDDPGNLKRARSLAERTYELSEFLVDVVGVTGFQGATSDRAAYHPSCHTLRELGVDRQPKVLLSGSGIEHIDLEAECCGFGGVFSIDQPELSVEMLKRKLEAIQKSDAQSVTACDVSCLMQIEGGLKKVGSAVRCTHLAQVLAGKPVGLR